MANIPFELGPLPKELNGFIKNMTKVGQYIAAHGVCFVQLLIKISMRNFPQLRFGSSSLLLAATRNQLLGMN
jgi:hypothetical protein